MADNRYRCIEKSKFQNSVSQALRKLENCSISKLTKYQSDALYSFLNGRDTFVGLPTGYGKSLIFQLAVGVAKELRIFDSVQSISLVVSPLTALIDEHILICENFGLASCKLDGTALENVDEIVKNSVIFTSPEVMETITTTKLIQKIEDRLLGIIVDESHCVVNWGLESSTGEAFRSAYGRIGNARAFTRAPFLCLTATASVKVRKKILKLLHMRNVKVIKLSPDKPNITIRMYTAEKEIDATFGWLVKELKENNLQTEKTIVYCQSIKNCGELYSIFDEEASVAGLFAMYHSKTPKDVQEKVISNFFNPEASIRIVFATSALGMGLNLPDVHRIIHYGIPHDIEQYVQEIGRSGRDGKQSVAILYYSAYHLAHCDDAMRKLVKNTSGGCRRAIIAEYFKEQAKKISHKHNCCDNNCSLTCDCGQESCSVKKEAIQNCQRFGTCSRVVEDEDRLLLRETLNEIRSDQKYKSSILGLGSMTLLDDEIIKDLVDNCAYIFTVEDIMEHFAIFDTSLAHQVLVAFNEVFDGDISDFQLNKDIATEVFDSNENDRYMFVPDWCTLHHSDSNSDTDELLV